MHLPYIIGHSALEDDKDIERRKESGIDDFLSKPSKRLNCFNVVAKWLASQ